MTQAMFRTASLTILAAARLSAQGELATDYFGLREADIMVDALEAALKRSD